MLQHVPAFLGHALSNVRAGHARLVVAQMAEQGLPDLPAFDLNSPAFASGEALPDRFTADAPGTPVSPPLRWDQPPEGTKALVLIVEDPDAPSLAPFCHWLAWGMEPRAGELAEGATPPATGRNSYQQAQWLAPDPPTGHGVHDYVFQLFALDTIPSLDEGAGRSAVVEAITGHAIGLALLTGTCERPG